MFQYWELDQLPDTRQEKSSSIKIIAFLVIFLIILATGLVFLLPPLLEPNSVQQKVVRVAIIDSGVDKTQLPFGVVVAEKSFIEPRYGYDLFDGTTGDSTPEGVPHGTLVTKTVLTIAKNVGIINAKVVSEDGTATTVAMIKAIYWAVAQNASVINLSVGGTPTVGDPLREAVRYAFSKGAVVVCAAGNSGDSRIAGTSISSPSYSPVAIAVGALDEYGYPDTYTSTGPTWDRSMKPDIVADGFIQFTSTMYYGTSFAAPRVSGAAAVLIEYCIENNIPYTPGLIKALLMNSASPVVASEYIVGAGALDVDAAFELLQTINKGDGQIPSILYVHPKTLPIEFERLFYGDNYTFNIQIINSKLEQYNVNIDSTTSGIFELPGSIEVNQTGMVPLRIHLPLSGPNFYSANITFENENATAQVSLAFSAEEPVARVAFDISRTTWTIDSVYGQFREFYKTLVENDISVTELRVGTKITLSLLQSFDGVVILDPSVWDVNETDPYNPKAFSLTYTTEEIDAYQSYFNDHNGSIFVVSLANSSTNVSAVNKLLGWSGFAQEFDEYPEPLVAADVVVINTLSNHPITTGVYNFDYAGSTLIVPSNATVLGWLDSKPVLACWDSDVGGRLVVSGSNFFVDNWGISGRYEASSDRTLALQIVLWMVGML